MLIGSGGREHALAWKLSASPAVSRVWVAPGNGGTSREPKVENVAIPATDIEALLEFAVDNRADLTLVGPEAPLAAGIKDRFSEAGQRLLGPDRDQARLESSKSFARDFMEACGVPMAAGHSFERMDEALDHLSSLKEAPVVKADGLAAGKGVLVASSMAEAEDWVRACMERRQFGDAGRKVVIERRLPGRELSLMGLCSGTCFLPFALSRDYKRRFDGDQGANTGGMGVISPAVVDPGELAELARRTIEPILRRFVAEGRPYRGFLYAGLMVDQGEVSVLEYNVRLGDPETQVLMMRLRSDFAELCVAALDGELEGVQLDWDPRPAAGVVLAERNYPGSVKTGAVIEGVDEAEALEGVKLFHAGTRVGRNCGRLKIDGGRVLCATALADDRGGMQPSLRSSCRRSLPPPGLPPRGSNPLDRSRLQLSLKIPQRDQHCADREETEKKAVSAPAEGVPEGSANVPDRRRSLPSPKIPQRDRHRADREETEKKAKLFHAGLGPASGAIVLQQMRLIAVSTLSSWLRLRRASPS